jgi:hypothetical protein
VGPTPKPIYFSLSSINPSPKYTIKTKTQIEKNKNRVILGKKSGSEVEK